MAADWSVLTPELVDLVEAKARKVASQYDGIVEDADLMQEGFILLATNAAKVREYLAEAPHYLDQWVWSRLTDVARKQLRQRGNTIPIERLVEVDGE